MLEIQATLSYTLTTKESITDQEMQIVQDYWSQTCGEFIYRPSLVARMHNLSNTDLQRSIKMLSRYHIIHGKCFDCGVEVTSEVYTQNALKAALKYPEERCNACKTAASDRWEQKYQEQERQHETRQQEQHLEAIANLDFHSLALEFLNFLFQLVERQVHTVQDVYQRMGISQDLSQEKKAWASIYHLAQVHLIRLVYQPLSNRIHYIPYDDTLIERVAALKGSRKPTCRLITVAQVSLRTQQLYSAK